MKRPLITAGLIIAILTMAMQPARPAGYAAGIAVICFGSYCIYKLVKTCQKVFPPKKSGETNSNEGFYAQGGDEYGGAYEYSSIGSCWEPPPPDFVNASQAQLPDSTTFTLNVIVEPDGLLTSMTASANTQEQPAQTWDQFQAEMASHGLFLTGRASYVPQFSRNGVPCDPSMVPLEFDQDTGRVTQKGLAGDLRRVVVERSPNLQDWSPLLQTDVGVGAGFKVIDTTREGACFYRVSLTQP